MKNMIRIGFAVLVLALLAACQPPIHRLKPTPVRTKSWPAWISPAPIWVLNSLDGSLPLAGTRVTLAFGNDGTANGTDGCNQFNGAYTQDGSNLTFAQPMASTMMACEDAIMSQATAYMNALAATTDFVGSTSQLVLRGGDEILATFVAESQDLAGTNWQVVGYNNGRQAVVGVIDGSEITANFGDRWPTERRRRLQQLLCRLYRQRRHAHDWRDRHHIPLLRKSPRRHDPGSRISDRAVDRGHLRHGRQPDGAACRQWRNRSALVAARLTVDLPQPEPEPAVPTGRVTAPSGVNIRSGPGTHYPILGFAALRR